MIPHMFISSLDRVRKEGSNYSWEPVASNDQWDEKK